MSGDKRLVEKLSAMQMVMRKTTRTIGVIPVQLVLACLRARYLCKDSFHGFWWAANQRRPSINGCVSRRVASNLESNA
jgi:hypothetical protein